MICARCESTGPKLKTIEGFLGRCFHLCEPCIRRICLEWLLRSILATLPEDELRSLEAGSSADPPALSSGERCPVCGGSGRMERAVLGDGR